MRFTALALLTSLLSVRAIAANASVVCDTKQVTDINTLEDLHDAPTSCIKHICTKSANTEDNSAVSIKRCGYLVLSIIHHSNTSLTTDDNCAAYFRDIINVCIATQGVQSGTLPTNEAMYRVDLARKEETSSSIRDLHTGTAEESVPAARTTQELQARRLSIRHNQKERRTARPTKLVATRRAKKSPAQSRRSSNKSKAKRGTCGARWSAVKRISTLAEIYDSIPPANKITTGNTKTFKIDNTKQEAFGATECIGCSVLIAINGKQLVMGHYAEEAGVPPTVTIESAPFTQTRIIDQMHVEMDSFEESEHAHAWLVHSSRQSRPAGLKPWREFMEHSVEVPEDQIHVLSYNPIRVIEGGLEGRPNGKIVVQTTLQAGGEVLISVYSNSDTPKWSQRYDAAGNPC